MVFILVLGACGSNKAVIGEEVDLGMSVRQLIGKHYDTQPDFKTLSARVKIDYSNGDKSQGFNVSLRMEKDKIIWISGPLGVVKAQITPDRVSFYNKLQNEYFDGDFGYLSDLLGTELDFEKVQNILLGNAMMDLRKERYLLDHQGNRYELRPRNAQQMLRTLFTMEPKHFKISSQLIAQPWDQRQLQASYTYQDIMGNALPDEIKIVAADQGETSHIQLEFRNLELDRTLNFPYQIPKGYDKITLK